MAYTIDQLNGTSTPTSGQVPVTANPDGSVSSPYDTFTNNMLALLKNVQASGNNPALLKQAQDLTQQSIESGNPNNAPVGSSVFQGMTPAARVQEEQEQENAYKPGILSLQNQETLQSNNAANEAALINSDIAAEKPVAKGLSDDIVTPGGTTVSPGFNANPDLNTGNYIGYNGRGGNGTSTGNGESTSAGTSTEVNGVQFGDARSSGGLGSYSATEDPAEYAAHVAQASNDINSLGTPTAATIDQWIKNQNLPGTVPVTGSMIMSASQVYGVDPTVLAGVLNHESSLGTAGSGAKTNNPGNQMANGNDIVYNTMQQGVNATAKNLASRQSSQYDATGALSPSNKGLSSVNDPVGGTYGNYIASKVGQLPSSIQGITRAGPLGVAYIDGTQLSNLPASFSTIATTQGSKVGIPVLDEDQSSAIKSIGNLYQYIGNLQPIVNKVLSNDQGGFLEIGKSKIHDTDPNYLTDLTNFNSVRTEAISAIQALAGGSGSGLRLSQGEIDSATNLLPTASDTLANANIKINNLQDLLKTKLASTFPYVSGEQPGASASSTTQGGSTMSNGVDLSKF